MNKSAIQQAAEILGYDAYSYSGRGMFGKHCLAINVEDPLKDIAFIALEAQNLDNSDVSSYFENVRTDSMGLRSVIYFPYVSYYDDDEDDE